MHVSGAHRPDDFRSIDYPDCEHYQYGAAGPVWPNSNEPILGLRMSLIRGHERIGIEQRLNLVERYAMLRALSQIAGIPIEAGSKRRPLPYMYVYTLA